MPGDIDTCVDMYLSHSFIIS
uniref:Uncharacterized protein n=1 Tax=Moniliophthora roreri TaxID=221103 RepID=A0A0W0ETS4_MONRR